MNSFQILLNIILVVCFCICENVIDVDDFLSPAYMPTTLLMLENPVNNKTVKYPNATSVVGFEGSLDKAILTMGYHRQMMNEYLCRNYIAEQIVQDMTISKMNRRMGVISHGPGMSTLQQSDSKSIQSGLLEDEGSSNYKNWLAKSTTLEDIYKHYDMGKRSDAGKDGEEKDDEEFDEQVIGYGYALPKPSQSPSKLGHSGEGIFLSSGSGGYPHSQHPSSSGTAYFGGSSLGGHSGGSNFGIHSGGSSFGGHSGGGSFGAGHHPVIHEQVIHVPKHHHHVKYVDKKEGLTELFEIALTALAFLSFGMFIVHVIMCISMTTNTTTTAMGMMMPTNTGNTETSTLGMDASGVESPGGEGIGMMDMGGDNMGESSMGGEGEVTEGGGDAMEGGGMAVDEGGEDGMEGGDVGGDDMGGGDMGGQEMDGGETGGGDTDGEDMEGGDTGSQDMGGDEMDGDDAGGDDIGGDEMEGGTENTDGENGVGVPDSEDGDSGGSNNMPSEGGSDNEGSDDEGGDGAGMSDGGGNSGNGVGEVEEGGGGDTGVIDDNAEIDNERIKDLFFLNGDFRSELLRKKILDRLGVLESEGNSRSIFIIENNPYKAMKGTGTGTGTATGGTSTGGTSTGGTATGGTATGGTATGSRIQEDDGITVETEEAAEVPVGPAFDGMGSYNSMQHRNKRDFSLPTVVDPNNYALNELARRILISIEAATLARTDNGVCLRKILCENNRYSRQLVDTNKIWIPVWSLGMSWLSSRLGINAQPSTSMLDSLKASILGLGKAKCEILYQNCDLNRRRRKSKRIRRPKI